MELKRLTFIGSSRDDLREFPEEVRQEIGYALFEVQKGNKPVEAKSLKLIRKRLMAAEEKYRGDI